MGLLDFILPKKKEVIHEDVNNYFKTFNAYTPSFTTYEGGLYEMELTRAAIHTFANQVSKLKPEVIGNARPELNKILQFKPNPIMDTSKFLYRIATILSVHNTAIIAPVYNKDETKIVGLYPLLPTHAEIIEFRKKLWLRYRFYNDEVGAIELDRVGIVTQYQYRDEFFGESNGAMSNTLKLLDIQNQGMRDAIKQSANIRFMAKLGQTLRPEDIDAEKKRFSLANLSAENNTGVMMFDAKYAEVKQIDSKPFLIDSEQMDHVKTNVYNYFGTNEDILQNKFDENTWNAYYEGKIEPFSTQLSLVLTNMLFTENEKSFGNQIMLTANRMQYASNQTKLQVSTSLFDRGILSTNDVMDIWNLPHVEDGDKRYIRREYTDVENLDKEELGEIDE